MLPVAIAALIAAAAAGFCYDNYKNSEKYDCKHRRRYSEQSALFAFFWSAALLRNMLSCIGSIIYRLSARLCRCGSLLRRPLRYGAIRRIPALRLSLPVAIGAFGIFLFKQFHNFFVFSVFITHCAFSFKRFFFRIYRLFLRMLPQKRYFFQYLSEDDKSFIAF